MLFAPGFELRLLGAKLRPCLSRFRAAGGGVQGSTPRDLASRGGSWALVRASSYGPGMVKIDVEAVGRMLDEMLTAPA